MEAGDWIPAFAGMTVWRRVAIFIAMTWDVMTTLPSEVHTVTIVRIYG